MSIAPRPATVSAATVSAAPLSSWGMSVSVVIPTKNEARNIGWVLERLPEGVAEVLLVDANSTDGTVEAAQAVRPDITVVTQTRKGKGNALAAGFEAASGDYIVMIDADGSMDPAEIHDFVAALDAGAQYAKGSRFSAGGGSDDITALRRAGNWGLNSLTNLLFGSRFKDLCYGYNAFTKDCVEAFALPTAHGTTAAQWGDGFEIETMINVRVAVAGKAITEVASFESERRYGVSNLNTFRDGFRVLGTIFDERRAAWARPRRTTTAVLAAPGTAETPTTDGSAVVIPAVVIPAGVVPPVAAPVVADTTPALLEDVLDAVTAPRVASDVQLPSPSLGRTA